MTFVEGWIAEEEIVAASCGCCLAAIGFEDLIESVADLLHFVVERDNSLVEELVSGHFLVDVEVCLQISRRIGCLRVKREFVKRETQLVCVVLGSENRNLLAIQH